MRFSPDNALNTHALHQPCDRAAGYVEAFPSQLPPDLAHAIDLPVRIENPLDLGAKRFIALGMIRQSRRIGALGQMVIIGGRGDRQCLADRFDPMRTAMVIPSRACKHALPGSE